MRPEPRVPCHLRSDEAVGGVGDGGNGGTRAPRFQIGLQPLIIGALHDDGQIVHLLQIHRLVTSIRQSRTRCIAWASVRLGMTVKTRLLFKLAGPEAAGMSNRRAWNIMLQHAMLRR